MPPPPSSTTPREKMAAEKRLRDGRDDGSSDEHPDRKQMRTIPSLANVIRETMLAKSLQKFLCKLEPMLRQVVHEEVQRGLVQGARSLQRSPRKQIQAVEASAFRLVFGRKLSLPIFTFSKIEDEDNNPLPIFIEPSSGGKGYLNPTALPPSIKVEIVVIDGDFSPDERGDWTTEEFERSIVKERTGRRPLLTGDVSVTIRGGPTTLIGDLMFTDNSSWIRSRHFRIGARVVPGSYDGLRIKEAMTEPFMVKDHRGESYKKHYPPSLTDDVWRLEKIGKEGRFHRKLSSEGINTVQDFLKLWVVNPHQLRKILGPPMSDRIWEVTLGHARTCVMNSKLYVHRKPRSTVYLNPVCQVKWIVVDGISYPRSLCGSQIKASSIEKMELEAYRDWNLLEEVDHEMAANFAPPQNGLLLQGAAEASSRLPTHQDAMVLSNYQSGGGNMVESYPENAQTFVSWYQSPPGLNTIVQQDHVYDMSNMSHVEDGSSTSQMFFHGS